jgi:hypothetical protein
VLRAIFKACHRKFESVAKSPKGAGIVCLDRTGSGRINHMYFSRKSEEYTADFYLMCRRTLTPAEWTIFKFRYLLGADTALCARRLATTVQALSVRCYHIEVKLGYAFRDTVPFGLWPLDQYFSDTVRGEKVAPTVPARRVA